MIKRMFIILIGFLIIISLSSCKKNLTMKDLMETDTNNSSDTTEVKEIITPETEIESEMKQYVDEDRFHNMDETIDVNNEFQFHVDSVILTYDNSAGGSYFASSTFLKQNIEYYTSQFDINIEDLRFLFITFTIKNLKSEESELYLNGFGLFNYYDDKSISQIASVIDFNKSTKDSYSKSYFAYNFQPGEVLQTTLVYIIKPNQLYKPYIYLGMGESLSDSKSLEKNKNKSLRIQFVNLGLDNSDDITN